MAPLDKTIAASRSLPGTDPDTLRAASEQLRALGVDDDIVLVTRDPAELMEFLGVLEPSCASSS